jgi:hypothetical protein
LDLQRSQPAPTTNTRKATEHTKETRGSTTTKNPRQKNTIPKASTQEKEHTEEPNGGAQKDTISYAEEIGGGNLPDLDIPVTTTQTETLPMKRTVLQTTGQCKKMKAHKEFLNLHLQRMMQS